MKVVVARSARADILGVGRHIAKDSVRAADQMMDRLEARCRDLDRLSLRFPVAYPGPPSIRRTSEGPYNIFYSVRADHVRIERILHCAQDVADEIFSG